MVTEFGYQMLKRMRKNGDFSSRGWPCRFFRRGKFGQSPAISGFSGLAPGAVDESLDMVNPASPPHFEAKQFQSVKRK
jgi:hypothetical protein